MSLAVLAGNEKDAAGLLSNHPSTLQERNLFGQTPLHLAVGRSACLRLLLQDSGTALLDQPDFSGYTPLEYAALSCKESCEGSMIVILESDCMVPNQFPGIFSKLCQACRGELLKHIQNRRERLKIFALERLPGAEASALGLDQTAVLDSKANLVTQTLGRRGFEVPSPLRIDVCLENRVGRFDTLNAQFGLYNPASMFHQNPLNSPFGSNLEVIFQLGFRDFEEFSSLELSPLFSWVGRPVYVLGSELSTWEANRIDACIWLVNHGANLWDPISSYNSATTAHYLYASIDLSENMTFMWDSARLKAQFLARTLSTHDVRDNCDCRCSPGGCSPFLWFLRNNINRLTPFPGTVDHRKDNIYRFPLLLCRWKPFLSVEQLRSAIRYLTFESLAIRHTCSHDPPQFEKRTADEIEELMSEDVSLLELLEELVQDFDSKLQSVITEEDPLGLRFWETHWSGRMREILEKLDGYRMNESELLSAQQLGVTWHHLDDSPEKHQTKRRSICYRESDWSVELDDVAMLCTLQSMEDWTSRLNLIMSTAIPGWR